MTPASGCIIRPQREGDAGAVARLLDAAFSGPLEARLVERLCAGGHLASALVAVEDGSLVGFVSWPRLRVEASDGTHAAVGLAPLAVIPPRQRAGIGAALVRAGLARLRQDGESLVFALGDPAYYGRFGFSVEAARAYDSVYSGEHFMALALSAAPEGGRVRYPAPFDELG